MKTSRFLALLAASFVVASVAPTAFAQDKKEPEVKKVEKQELKKVEKQEAKKTDGADKKASAATAKIGSAAPAFTLKDTDGKEHNLAQYTKEGKIVVIEWFNPDCPFVKKHHKTADTFKKLNEKYAKDGKVVFLAINSGAAGKQGAGLDRNKAAKTEYGIAYPILLDETGATGKNYGAKTTPHMYVIAADGTLAYMGAIDDDNSIDKMGKTNYVAKALDELLAGKKVTTTSTDAYGCAVKY